MPGEEGRGTPDIEGTLGNIWSEVLKTDAIGVNDSFFALGGDSISSLLVAAKALEAGIDITALQVLEQETIANLAAIAVVSGASALGAEDEDVAVGETGLTPIQHWFFEQDHPDASHWNMAAFLNINKELREEVFAAALAKVTEHHDALRSKFYRRDGGWVQHIQEESCAPWVEVADLRGHDDSARSDLMLLSGMRAQEQIDITSGRLVSAVLFKTRGQWPDKLLLLVHHLVVDSVSMRIIIQDLETACHLLDSGKEVALPEKTMSIRAWQKSLVRYSGSPSALGQLDYWRTVPKADPLGYCGDRPTTETPENTVGRAKTIRVTVPAAVVSELMENGHRVTKASLRDILLAAFLLAWREQAGGPVPQLDLEGHGREPLDRSVNTTRTVGWFTTIFPVSLDIPETLGHPGTADVLDVLRAIHEQLEKVPERGVCYGILRYLSGSRGAVLAGGARSRVSFNYLGWVEETDDDRLFGPPMPGPWPLRHEDDRRQHLLEIIISGAQGEMNTDFVYAGDFYLAESMHKLADRYIGMLSEISASLTACPR